MKKGITMLLSAVALFSLAGCGHKPSDKTPLQLTNVKSYEAKTDGTGKFTVQIKSDKDAKVTIATEIKNGTALVDTRTVKLDKNGKGSATVSVTGHHEDGMFMIKAKSGTLRRTSKDFLLDNNSKEYSTWVAQKNYAKDLKKHKESIADSKESASESKEADSQYSSESRKKASESASSAAESTQSSHAKTGNAKVGNSSYKIVSLNELSENPDKYDGENIQTSGTILYIQKNPDDSTMYFAVIDSRDSSTSSGYSDGHGSVAQIDVDTMKEYNLTEGDDITVDGGSVPGTVTVNGKKVKSSIIVDYVRAN